MFERRSTRERKAQCKSIVGHKYHRKLVTKTVLVLTLASLASGTVSCTSHEDSVEIQATTGVRKRAMSDESINVLAATGNGALVMYPVRETASGGMFGYGVLSETWSISGPLNKLRADSEAVVYPIDADEKEPVHVPYGNLVGVGLYLRRHVSDSSDEDDYSPMDETHPTGGLELYIHSGLVSLAPSGYGFHQLYCSYTGGKLCVYYDSDMTMQLDNETRVLRQLQGMKTFADIKRPKWPLVHRIATLFEGCYKSRETEKGDNAEWSGDESEQEESESEEEESESEQEESESEQEESDEDGSEEDQGESEADGSEEDGSEENGSEEDGSEEDGSQEKDQGESEGNAATAQSNILQSMPDAVRELGRRKLDTTGTSKELIERLVQAKVHEASTVLARLPDKTRGVFKLLAQYQQEKGDAFTGLAFDDFHSKCRARFLLGRDYGTGDSKFKCTSEDRFVMTMRVLMEHNLIVATCAISDVWLKLARYRINFDNEHIQKILCDMESINGTGGQSSDENHIEPPHEAQVSASDGNEPEKKRKQCDTGPTIHVDEEPASKKARSSTTYLAVDVKSLSCVIRTGRLLSEDETNANGRIECDREMFSRIHEILGRYEDTEIPCAQETKTLHVAYAAFSKEYPSFSVTAELKQVVKKATLVIEQRENARKKWMKNIEQAKKQSEGKLYETIAPFLHCCGRQNAGFVVAPSELEHARAQMERGQKYGAKELLRALQSVTK